MTEDATRHRQYCCQLAQAREQLRELVGEIRLAPTGDGYLEARLAGQYEGLMKLAVGANGNNLVAGEGFGRYFAAPVLRIALR